MMQKTIFSVVLTVLLSAGHAGAQQASTADKIKDKITIKEANSAFLNEAYSYALDLYQKAAANDDRNSFLNYRIGFCLMKIQELDRAVEYFEKVSANQLKSKHLDFHYAYGMTLQKQGKYNSALEQYNLFVKNGRKKEITYYEPERFIKKCSYAIANVEKPVSVQMEPLGGNINSTYNDYHPLITVDGKRMFFTSRRSSNKNTDLLEDNQYFENMYMTTWNDTTGDWREAVLMEGRINAREEYTAGTGVSPDGQQILVYKNSEDLNKKILASVGSGDILISSLGKNGKWKSPKVPEGLNSDYYDGGACFSPDGKKIYFISSREGFLHGKNVGGRDIWVSELQEDDTWGKPTNLGPTVNSPYNEWSVFMHPNGKTLFFSSEGHDDKNFGGFDVYKTELKDGKWTTPVNLGFPINTAGDEKEFSLSADGLTGYVSAQKNLDDKYDIFEIDLSFYNVLTGENAPLSLVSGNVLDGSLKTPMPASIEFTNTANGEKTTIEANSAGKYVVPLESNTTYKVVASKKGYQTSTSTLALKLPEKPVLKKKKRRRRRKKGETEKGKLSYELHSVIHNVKLERENPLNIVHADLFETKTVRFDKTAEGYVINEISKSLLDNAAEQIMSEPRARLVVTAHFDDDNDNYEVSLGESAKLGKLVSDYLQSKGATLDNVEIYPRGNNEPMADSDTPQGKTINRRVELKFSL